METTILIITISNTLILTSFKLIEMLLTYRRNKKEIDIKNQNLEIQRDVKRIKVDVKKIRTENNLNLDFDENES